MNTAEFRESIHALHNRLLVLTDTKGEEYKRREDNQFANFERGAAAMGLIREQVLMVYLSKHLDSITTYIRDLAAGQDRVYAEPISGRIDDAILYLLLLRGMTIENDVITGRRIFSALFGEEEAVESGGCAPPVLARSSEPFYPVDATPAPPDHLPTWAGDKKRVFVLASLTEAAVSMCKSMGLPLAVAALSNADQLHGVTPGAEVVVIHCGQPGDDGLVQEALTRGRKQGLTVHVVPHTPTA